MGGGRGLLHGAGPGWCLQEQEVTGPPSRDAECVGDRPRAAPGHLRSKSVLNTVSACVQAPHSACTQTQARRTHSHTRTRTRTPLGRADGRSLALSVLICLDPIFWRERPSDHNEFGTERCKSAGRVRTGCRGGGGRQPLPRAGGAGVPLGLSSDAAGACHPWSGAWAALPRLLLAADGELTAFPASGTVI